MRVVAPLILGLVAQGAVLSSHDQCGPMNKAVQQMTMVHGKMSLDLKMTEQENDKYGCWFNRFTKEKNELITNSTAGITQTTEDALAGRKEMAGAEANIQNAESKVAQHNKDLDDKVQEKTDTITKCEADQHHFRTTNAKLAEALKILNAANKASQDAQKDSYSDSEEKGQTEASMNAFMQLTPHGKFEAIFTQEAVSKLNAEQRVAVNAFLQKQAKYGFQSGVIVGIIDSMVDDTQADLDRSIQSCKDMLCNEDMDGCDDNVGSITQAIVDLNEAIKKAEENLASSTDALTAATEKMKTAEQDLANHKATLLESQDLLAAEQATYREHQREFSEHVKLAKGEMDAVVAARQVLQCVCMCKQENAPKDQCESCPQEDLFLQLSAHGKLEDSRVKLANFLKARVGHNFALAEVYAEVSLGGQFDPIVTHVQKMQSDLREEMRTDKNAYNICVKDGKDLKALETATKTSKAGAEKKMKFHDSQIKALKASIEETENNINNEETDLAAASSMRQQENKTFKKLRSENQVAMNAMDKAIGILNDYYKNNLKEGRFLQMSKPKYAIDKNKSYKKDVKKYEKKSGVVFEILNQIKRDIAKEMTENKAAENEAQAEYKKMVESRQTTIDEWNDSIAEMKVEISKNTVKYQDNNAIFEKTSDALSSVENGGSIAVASGTHNKSCGWMQVKETYRARVQKQEDNMKMLKYTVCVLRGGTDADCGGLASL